MSQKQQKVEVKKATTGKGSDLSSSTAFELPEVDELIEEADQIQEEVETKKTTGCGCGW